MCQPLLSERRIHKEPDPLGLHQLLLGPKRWRVVTQNGDVADVSLQRRVAGEALALGFVRLQTLEVFPAQIEHEVD